MLEPNGGRRRRASAPARAGRRSRPCARRRRRGSRRPPGHRRRGRRRPARRGRCGRGRSSACRSAPESNSSRLSLQCTRSIRPVIFTTSSTTVARSLPPACAWQVSRQKPTMSKPSATEIASQTPRDPLEVAGHRVVAAGGVLDEQRQLEVGRLDRLAPVVEALRGVVGLVDVAAVHDQALGADRGRGVHVLLQQLAARDPDPVVGGGHVDDVRRMDVEVHAGSLGGGAQRLGPAGVSGTPGPCSPAGRRGRTARGRRRGPGPRRRGRSGRRGRRSADPVASASCHAATLRPGADSRTPSLSTLWTTITDVRGAR